MSKYSLEPYRDLLESSDSRDHNLALIMINELPFKDFTLAEILTFSEEYSKYIYGTYDRTSYGYRVKMKISKRISKFSKTAISNYYKKKLDYETLQRLSNAETK